MLNVLSLLPAVLAISHMRIVDACLGNVKIPTDPREQIPTLVKALSLENGNSRYEGPFPDRTRMGMVYVSSELDCDNFDDCAWRNEFGEEGATDIDEFDWGLASGRPDPIKASQVFATANTAFPADNSDKWALTGTMQGKDKANEDGALLVSDPVACQLGPGKFFFKYWASPGTEVRVCTRKINDAKNYIQCQPSPTSPPWYRQYFTQGWPSPGPVEVRIPPNTDPFEIVIVANKFNYFVSANGRSGYGAVVALDDISYRARLCPRPSRTTTTTTTARPTPTTTRRSQNLEIPTDPREQIPAIVKVLSLKTGNSDYEGPLPERTQPGIVFNSSELNCNNFEDCAWRNEFGEEGAPNIDELDFGVASGRPDLLKTRQVFGTSNTAFPADNRDKWALTGTMRGQNKANEDGALMVSDPVGCQIGPGKFSFKYWASQGTEVRVCTRRPNDAKNYIQCQPSLNTPPWYRHHFSHGRPSPGPVEVTIPANREAFEIVIVATKFNNFVSAFGRSGSGGVVAIDEISYQARLCPRHLPSDPDKVDRTACKLLFCTVDQGECISQLNAPGSPWEIRDTPYSSIHTAIRKIYDGSYALAKGPTTRPATLTLGPFQLAKDRPLRFCFYQAYHGVRLSITRVRGRARTQLYKSPLLNSKPNLWHCKEIPLVAGQYDKLVLAVDNLRSRYSKFGLDDIKLLSTPGGRPLC